MKNVLRILFSFVAAGVFAVSLASQVAAQCDVLIAGDNVSCYLTGEDEVSCHYACYCTGTEEQCDQFLIENGLY